MDDKNEICNDPHLCGSCGRTSEWPICMKNTKLRGYHPIFKDNWDEVVECDNWKTEQYEC